MGTSSGTTSAGTNIPAPPLSRWRGGLGKPSTIRRCCPRCLTDGTRQLPGGYRSRWNSRCVALTATLVCSSRASCPPKIRKAAWCDGLAQTRTLQNSNARMKCANAWQRWLTHPRRHYQQEAGRNHHRLESRRREGVRVLVIRGGRETDTDDHSAGTRE